MLQSALSAIDPREELPDITVCNPPKKYKLTAPPPVSTYNAGKMHIILQGISLPFVWVGLYAGKGIIIRYGN